LLKNCVLLVAYRLVQVRIGERFDHAVSAAQRSLVVAVLLRVCAVGSPR